MITAQFIADFTSFKAAVDDATTHLKTFQTGAASVEKALTRIGDSFSGRSILQQATLATKAVLDMGGATTLTAKEQASLNAILTEAIAKYAALGQTAPKAMVDLAAATQQAAVPTQALTDQITAWTIAQGTAAGNLLADGIKKVGDYALEAAKSIPHMVEETMNLGAELYRQSEKTGISIEALSKLRYVAAQTGTDLTSLTGMIFKMEANLGGVGKAGENFAAILHDRLHLSLAELRDMKPDEAFAKIMAALGELPTQAERSAVGMQVFGKSFRTNANLAKEDIGGLINEAQRLGLEMSAHTAAAAKVTDDSFTTIHAQFEAVRLQIGAALLPAVAGLSRDFSGAFASAVKTANAELDKMGSGDGFMSHVINSFGKGNVAIAAQAALYNDLRNAMVALVRGGVEPMLTGFSFLAESVIYFGVGLTTLSLGVDGLQLSFRLVIEQIQKLNSALHLPWAPSAAEMQTYRTGTEELMASMAKRSDAIVTGAAAAEGIAKTHDAAIRAIDAGLKEFEKSAPDINATIDALAKKLAGGLTTGAKTAGDAAAGASDDLKKLEKEAADLATKIDAAQKGMQPAAEITEEYGKKAYELSLQLRAQNDAVPPLLTSLAALYRQSVALKQLDEANKGDTPKGNETGFKALGFTAEDAKIAEASQVQFWKTSENLTKIGVAANNEQRLFALQYQLALDKQAGKSEETLFADKERLAEMEVTIARETADAKFAAEISGLDPADAHYKDYVAEHAKADAALTVKSLHESELRAAGELSSHEKMMKSLGDLASAFTQLGTISGGAFGGVAKEIGTFIGALQLAAKSAEQMKQALAEMQAAQAAAAAAAQAHAAATNASGAAATQATGTFKFSAAGLTSMATAALGAVSALDAATKSSSHLVNALQGAATGASFGEAFGPWGAAIGAAVGGLFGAFRGTGGPSPAEVAGRAAAADFTKGLQSGLNEAQIVETHQLVAAGNSAEWATQVVAIRDAYVKAGFSIDDALDAVNRLYAAEKQGGTATTAVIDEITAKMGDMGKAAEANQKEIDDMVNSLDGNTLFHEADVAVAALARIGNASMLTDDEAKKLHDTITAAIAKYKLMGLEVPAALTEAEKATARVTAETQKLSDTQDQVLQKLRQVYNFQFQRGEGGEGQSDDRNTSGIFTGMTEGEAELLWLADVASKDSTDQDWDRVKGQYGFRYGTGGRYVDFGEGTPVWLHGRERVMTEGEDGGDGGGNVVVNVLLDGQVLTRSVMKNLPGTLSVYGLH